MPVTVRFNPTANSEQAQVIPDATVKNAGVMTPAMVAQLQKLGVGGPIVVWANGETWDQLKTKAANVGGTAIVVIPFDDYTRTITGTQQNISNLYFFGMQGLTLFHTRLNCTITIDPGATFITDFRLRSFNIIWQSSAHVGAGAPFYMELTDGAWIHSHATDAAFEAGSSPANPACTVVLYGDAAITAAGAASVFNAVDTTGLLAVVAFGSNLVSAHALSGGAGSAVELEAADTAQVDYTTVFTGAGSFVFLVFPALYQPSDLTKWSGTDPKTVGNALDRIAAALGPIA